MQSTMDPGLYIMHSTIVMGGGGFLGKNNKYDSIGGKIKIRKRRKGLHSSAKRIKTSGEDTVKDNTVLSFDPILF